MIWAVTVFIKLMLLLTEQKGFWNEWGRLDTVVVAFQTVDQSWPLNPVSDSADKRTKDYLRLTKWRTLMLQVYGMG